MKNIYLIVGPSEGVKVIGLFAAEEVCKRRMRARGDSKEAVNERLTTESRSPRHAVSHRTRKPTHSMVYRNAAMLFFATISLQLRVLKTRFRTLFTSTSNGRSGFNMGVTISCTKTGRTIDVGSGGCGAKFPNSLGSRGPATTRRLSRNASAMKRNAKSSTRILTRKRRSCSTRSVSP